MKSRSRLAISEVKTQIVLKMRDYVECVDLKRFKLFYENVDMTQNSYHVIVIDKILTFRKIEFIEFE